MGVISFEGGIPRSFTMPYHKVCTNGSRSSRDRRLPHCRGRHVPGSKRSPLLRREGNETEIRLDPRGSLRLFYQHFNRAVQNGAQPFATGEDGFRSLAVALAALESSKGKRTAVHQHQPYTPLSVPKTLVKASQHENKM